MRSGWKNDSKLTKSQFAYVKYVDKLPMNKYVLAATVIALEWHYVHSLYVKLRIVCMSRESLQSFQQNKRATRNGLIATLVLDQSSNVSTISWIY